MLFAGFSRRMAINAWNTVLCPWYGRPRSRLPSEYGPDRRAPKIPGVNLRGVSWGAEHGANTDRVAEALPPATKGLEEQATGPEVDAAEWAQLLEDPLFEIRLAAVRGETTSAGPTLPLPAQTTPGQLRWWEAGRLTTRRGCG